MKDNAKNLSKHDNLYRTIIETVKDVTSVWDMHLTLIYVSPSVNDLLGYNSEETEEILRHWKKSDLKNVIAPGSMKTFSDTVGKWIKENEKQDASERHSPVELELIRKDGSTIWTETNNSFLRNRDGERTGFFSITRDISERKHALETLLKSEEKYRNILENIEEGYFENDLAGNLTFFNNALHRAIGYSKKELMGMNNRKYTTPETSKQIYETFREIYATGKPAKIAGYELIRKDGSTRIYDLSASLLSDSSGRPAGFRGIIRDITESRSTERELERSYSKLQNMLEETIKALAFTVEVRDPYTAGHQRRVAQLACAISRNMNLSSEEARGVKMAALIHDVGKIQIPAEVLSKPGRLTTNEMGLIKTHSEVGSNILKGIEFPWPISEIVLQHHERTNGSGYPYGISGKEMRVEAKIIAVADVVEAMVSHRPYRPALRINEAIEEISQNKGILYDTEAVEACQSLFSKEGFAFTKQNFILQ
ncbi:MAG: PAS domain S-box protein [Deltaproteobacteria bacterium]|nr:PAS domain S-box protein [Deltaproteobacteria bacterium]